MTQGVQYSLINNKLRDSDIECDHIYGIFFFQIIVPKSEDMHIDLDIIVFNFMPLRFVSSYFPSLASSLF